MTSKNSAVYFVAFLLVASIAQHAWYWPQLPERVATHFGADGQPNDWMSRTASTLLLAGLQIGVPLFLMLINAISGRLPASMLNIPNKDYWLSPERRGATLCHMSRMMTWIIVLTASFMIVTAHLTFLANRNGTGLNMPVFGTALGIFLLCVFSIAGNSMWHFRRPAEKH